MKSTRNQFEITTDDKGMQSVTARMGLFHKTHRLSVLEDGKIQLDGNDEQGNKSEFNRGIEEAINTFDEFVLMSRLLEIPVDSFPKDLQYIILNMPEEERRAGNDSDFPTGLRYLFTIYYYLFKDKKLDQRIRAAQLSGDPQAYNSLRKFFNSTMDNSQEDSWGELNVKMDEVLAWFYEHNKDQKLSLKSITELRNKKDNLEAIIVEYLEKAKIRDSKDINESAEEI
jgi:hypothetical protein